jgi:hypothetical protein
MTSLGITVSSMRNSVFAPAKSIGRPSAAPALVSSNSLLSPIMKLPVKLLLLLTRLSASVPPFVTSTTPVPDATAMWP